MKPTLLLLAASLVANLAFVAVFATRSSDSTRAAAQPPAVRSASSDAASGDKNLRAALRSGDARALEAAGVDRQTAREIAFGHTFAGLAEKIRAARPNQNADSRWWRSPASTFAGTRDQQLLLRRELAEALTKAFGEDLGLYLAKDSGGGALDFLPDAKREALRRIIQDYDEMFASYSAGGVQLASDREKLKLLKAERDRDIAALLSPEERLTYEMRTSPTAATVRARYGDGLETEEDYRKVYALQKAFDEKFPPDSLSGKITPEAMRARSDAQRQLQDDIRTALGDTAYAQLRRATDPDLRTVDALVTRLNLPTGTTDRIATVRETLATESQRINADSSLPLAQRRAQIQELGTQARTAIQQALGGEAAEAYAQRSPWVSMLGSGIAYSTSQQAAPPGTLLVGSQSVYPVMPSGVGLAAGTTRQMVVTGATTIGDGASAHGDVLLGGATPGVRENVQVLTFTTTTSETSTTPNAPAGGGQTSRTIIVAPPPPASPRP